MAEGLVIRTPNGDFDLFGNEDIVQTSGIFNLSDITIRTGEYTNLISFPITNNNLQILEYADFMTSLNTLPYKKVSAQIIVDGLVIKNGFIAIPEIKDTIQGRFYSGNTVFYDLIKNLNLGDLDWSTYDHIWNYTNATASSVNTSGYVYPVMDYGGQNLAGDIVDIRKILPATFCRTILDLIISQTGYTAVEDFYGNDFSFNKTLLPFSSKNPQISSQIQLLNNVDIGLSNNINPIVYSTISPYKTLLFNSVIPITRKISNSIILTYSAAYANEIYIPIDFNIINTAGSSVNYDFVNRKFTAQYSGSYDYDFLLELTDYDYMFFSFDKNIQNFNAYTSTTLEVIKVSGGISSVISSYISNTGSLVTSGSGSYPNIPPITQTYLGNNITGNVQLNVGDELIFKVYVKFSVSCSLLTDNTTASVTFTPTVKDISYIKIDLKPQLVFGGLITYSSLLPKMKCNEFLKDMSVRFGIILKVDDETKTITLTNLTAITNNIPNAIDLSDKLDESEIPSQQFSLDSYAQNNNFKHAEDKSILSTPNGTDYNMVINNTSLETEKDLYKSPFAPSVNVSFNGFTTTYINLYDVNTGNFDNDVKPRICYSKQLLGNQFKFTDGTTTSGYFNTTVIWFIDDTVPETSMGFGISLIPKNSKPLIDILQNLRLVKANFNLNIIDIKTLDPLIPIYIKQFQSYFILAQINQFNYTKPNLTEVELIKLN